MKRKSIHDISANFLPVIITRFSGIILFFIRSKYLIKNDFGEIKRALAVLMIVFIIPGAVIDQVTVRKAAAGIDPSLSVPPYLFPVLLTRGNHMKMMMPVFALTFLLT